MSNMIILDEKRKQQNLPPSQQVNEPLVSLRNNVIIRKIQKLIYKTADEMPAENLDELKKVYLMIDIDLNLRKEDELNDDGQEDELKKIEKRMREREEQEENGQSQLLSFLDESNTFLRAEMYFLILGSASGNFRKSISRPEPRRRAASVSKACIRNSCLSEEVDSCLIRLSVPGIG
jgi:hypothetical protein